MKINVTLSPSGIEKAVQQLEKYKQDLNTKITVFLQRLGDAGIDVVKANMRPAGDYIVPDNPDFRLTHGGRRGVLSLSGKDVLFVEFGAGVHYNGALGNSPNPKGVEMGYFIGSYPGQTHAGEDKWYYRDEDGQPHKTHGTQAGMPMYKASQYMRGHIREIAREVFNTDG